MMFIHTMPKNQKKSYQNTKLKYKNLVQIKHH